MIKKFFAYFTIFEWCLWGIGIVAITASFFIFSAGDILSYLSSVFGLTSLILMAKGNFVGLIIGVVFALTYAMFSYTQAYYGEMLIYLCVYLPLKIISIFNWIKNKFGKNVMQVKVGTFRRTECIVCSLLIFVLTMPFYFLLKYLNTDNLTISTISLIPSLAATYCMLRRIEYFSLCYVVNDIVMVIMWSIKLSDGFDALPSVIAFSFFILNDLYSFINWKRLKKKQRG